MAEKATYNIIPGYGDYYRFCCQSYAGYFFDVIIKKKDYAGQVKDGILGRSPVLRRDKNECIMGSSLELYVECQVDGEFAEFYTSDPTQYRVELYYSSLAHQTPSLLFSGYIIPELYSEPDIAPPYDVQITAADGLGELKLSTFKGDNNESLDAMLRRILAHTGLNLDLYYDQSIRCPGLKKYDKREQMPWSLVNFDIRHLDGETDYDVLQKVLATLNAKLFQYRSNWLLVRENDVQPFFHRAITGDYYDHDKRLEIQVGRFGQLGNADFWPVGHLDSKIIPAKNKVTLRAADNYRESILENSFGRRSGAWHTEGTVSYTKFGNAEYCHVLAKAGSSMEQEADFEFSLARSLNLCLKAIYGEVNLGQTDDSRPVTVRVTVEVKCEGGISYWLMSPNGGHTVEVADYPGFINFQLNKYDEPKEFKVELPLSLPAAPAKAVGISIKVENTQDVRKVVVTECSLIADKKFQTKGFELSADIQNGAREEMKKIDVITPYNSIEYRHFGSESVYGIPFTTNGQVSFKNKVFTVDSFFSESFPEAVGLVQLMARDYIRSWGLPRLQMTGCLNMPKAELDLPIMEFLLKNGKGITFFLETFSWSLAEDEMDVTMVSLPSADVTIVSESAIVIED